MRMDHSLWFACSAGGVEHEGGIICIGVAGVEFVRVFGEDLGKFLGGNDMLERG